MSLLSATMLLGSCDKEFLEKEPYSSVPIETAITTEAELQAAVNGMYALMRDDNTFGRNIPVIGDLMADNTYVSSINSGRYLTQNNYTATASTGEASNMWTILYRTILRANTVINVDLPDADPEVVSQLKGEAYAVRALVYHELVKLYATPYTVNPNAPGVPIVTVFEQNAEPARNTVQEVYDQIISDYMQAYEMMSADAENSSYMSKYAAKALQARAYLFMGDYEKAKEAALDVVDNGGYSLVTEENYVSYWANPTPVTNKVGTLFEISVDAIDNNGSDDISNIYDQDRYGDILATPELVSLYADGDVRGVMTNEDGEQVGVIVKGERGNDKPAYIVNKYQNAGSSADRDDIKIIRYSEVLLILAEAQARTGDDAAALETLNMLVEERGIAPYTSTGEQLIQDILTERRKELAFEGHRFWTLQRLNLPITRSVKNLPSAREIAVDNFRRLQPIPQAEIDANPNIEQNPGY